MAIFDIMSTAQNAIEAYNEALTASSANIANMNVTGYKRVNVSFQSIFEKIIAQGTAADGNTGGTNPRQLGSGIAISQSGLDFSAGTLSAGSGLDLAVSGNGLFILSPDGGSSYLYTRAGSFSIDSSGNLTSNGMQVYGFNTAGTVVPITALPSGNKSDYQWLANGTLQYSSDGGATYINTGYSIALTYFQNPSGLAQAQGTTFAETFASGSAATPQAPGGAVGSINPGQIEQSNVFYLGETIHSLELQRAMSANLSVVKMASDIISNFISKLG